MIGSELTKSLGIFSLRRKHSNGYGGAGPSGRGLLLLADTEDDELGRLDRRDPDLDHELALVDRLRRVGLRVALDVERLGGRRAEQRARLPKAPQERVQRAL